MTWPKWGPPGLRWRAFYVLQAWLFTKAFKARDRCNDLQDTARWKEVLTEAAVQRPGTDT